MTKYNFPPENIRNVLILGPKIYEIPVCWNIRNLLGGLYFLEYHKFSQGGFILFLWLGLKIVGFHFQKYKNLFNIRARKFHFGKYKNSFLSEKYKQNFFFLLIFLIFELESSTSGNKRNSFRVFFFSFLGGWDRNWPR